MAFSVVVALTFLAAFHSVAHAQIALDGLLTESDWNKLGDSKGGPPPSFGAGHEINALYADIDANYLYIGVAGNVQFGNRILVFIDSLPGGYTNSNFGRNAAPTGIANFNPTAGTAFSQFDDGFTPNYVLVISTNNGQTNYFWDLYTLSGSLGFGGGPNLYLGDRNDGDLRANPGNSDQTRGFESRLTYSSSGSGVDIAVSQSEVRMMAMYINDGGTLSNQFITHANVGETGNYGSWQILFNNAAPNPVLFGNMVVINEIDYIQPVANVSEFIEIKNVTNIPINLDSFHLRFARGINSPPDVYRDIDLPSINLNPNAYFVVCTNPANVPNCNHTVEPPMDLLENAIPAAVALVQYNVIVDVVSYGGNTGVPYSEGAGVVPTDDGTQAGLGISRIVDGRDTNRNNVDFGLRCVTPGGTNSAQTGGCGPETPTFTPTFTPTPTGTSQTPTPTGTSTPTGTPRPTRPGPVTSAPPLGCRNILVNGDFESAYGWDFGNDPIPGKYTSIPVHGGIRAVQLGIPPESGHAPVYSYSSVRQSVSIPPGSTVQLRWWHYHKTELTTLSSATANQDRQEVILLKPNGDTLHVVQRVRYNENNWQQSLVDLTEYAGHSFVLYFNVINYGSGRTWTFIDDVELLVCTPQGATQYHGNNTYPSHNTYPSDNTYPGNNAYPSHNTYPGNNAYPSDNTYPGNNAYPSHNTYPGNNAYPSHDNKSYSSSPSSYGQGSTIYYNNMYGTSGNTPFPTVASPYAMVTPTSTPVPGVQLGNAVEQNGYSLTALTVENPSTRYGSLYQPQAGQKFVAVELILRNVSAQAFTSNSLSATLVDASGFLYGAESVIGVGNLELLTVNPGELVQGWVGFTIPQSATPASLKYQFFGNGTVLQVGLGTVAVSSAAAAPPVALVAYGTSTPTVTPTNTGSPSPTPSPTSTSVAFAPALPENDVAQQLTPQALVLAQNATQPLAAAQPLPTPTVLLIANRQVIPDNCIELVSNGSFEARGMGWSQEGSKILPVYAAPPLVSTGTEQSGMAIRLGVTDAITVMGISATQQLIQLPKDRNKITLRFRYFPQYDAPLSRGDFQYVDIYADETGQFLGRALGVQRDDRAWIEREYDLSSSAGESIRVFFMVSNDGVGGNIAMYIDDVSIIACRVTQVPQNNLATQVETLSLGVSTAQPAPITTLGASAARVPQEELTATSGFAFGRMGGLLAVLGIASAALIALPISRRWMK